MATNYTNPIHARMGTLIPTLPGLGSPTGASPGRPYRGGQLGGPLLERNTTVRITTETNGETSFFSATQAEIQSGRRATVRCGRKCLCCHFISTNDIIYSSTMRRSYLPVNISDFNLSCESLRVIYVVTCRRCALQYVGQTKRKLKERVREHRLSILHNDSLRYLIAHFNSNGHTIEDFSVQIAEIVKNDHSLTEREGFWIRLLNTGFPFGLNDNITGYGNISEGTDPLQKTNHPYFSIPLPYRRRCKKPVKKRRNKNLNFLAIEELKKF